MHKRIAFLLCCSLMSVGCAVLTDSQVAQVNSYAHKVDAFVDCPREVLTAYGESRVAVTRLQLATYAYENDDLALQAWEDLRSARDFVLALEVENARIEQALAMVKKYTALLVILSSDEYVKKLDERAQELGEALHDATDAYNGRFGQQIPSVGAYVAGGVRGVCGVYLRHRQAEMVQRFVQEGLPLIEMLTRDIDVLMQPFVTSEEGGYFGREKERLKEVFIQEAMQSGEAFAYESIRCINDLFYAIENGQALAKQCHETTQRIRVAHEKIAQQLTQKKDIAKTCEELKKMYEEIDAALDLRKKLKQ